LQMPENRDRNTFVWTRLLPKTGRSLVSARSRPATFSVLTRIRLENGYHSGLGILFPPEDDDWWDGEFTHFNFDRTLAEIVKSVPKTMALKSFQPVKWILECGNQNEPATWNESDLTFFSEVFIDFLEKEGTA
jgi:hypothetical protein